MLRFLANTRLGAQMREACAAYRDLRIAQHRAAYRMKRASVRAAVLSEVRRSQLQELLRRRDAAIQLAAIRSRAAVKKSALCVKRAELQDSEVKYKADLVAQAEKLVPQHARGVAAGRIMSDVLRSTVASAPVDPTAHGAKKAAQVVAAFAKQTGCTEKEMEEMIKLVAHPTDETLTSEMRRNVMQAMRDAESEKAAARASKS